MRSKPCCRGSVAPAGVAARPVLDEQHLHGLVEIAGGEGEGAVGLEQAAGVGARQADRAPRRWPALRNASQRGQAVAAGDQRGAREVAELLLQLRRRRRGRPRPRRPPRTTPPGPARRPRTGPRVVRNAGGLPPGRPAAAVNREGGAGVRARRCRAARRAAGCRGGPVVAPSRTRRWVKARLVHRHLRRSGGGTVVAVLERRHAVERVAVGAGIAGLDAERIPERDERRHRLVPLVEPDRRARRRAAREVGERDAGVAVGHRLQQDRRVARRLPAPAARRRRAGVCTACPTSWASTTSTPVGPYVAQDLGDEAVGVPDHGVGRRAVEGLARHVGGATARTAAPVRSRGVRPGRTG